jgi:hypothetical protein
MVDDRHEPIPIQVFERLIEYNACRAMFRATRWHSFFAKFQGYNDQVTFKIAE